MYLRTRVGILLVVGSTTLTAVGCTTDSLYSDVPILEFREIGSYEIPDSFPVGRGFITQDSTVILISQRWNHVLSFKNELFTEIGVDVLESAISAAMGPKPGQIQIVDADLHSVVEFDEGVVSSVYPISSTIHLMDASQDDLGRWWMVGRDSTGVSSVVLLDSVGEPTTLSLPFDPNIEASPLIIFPTTSGSIISASATPAMRLAIDVNGNIRDQSLPDHVFPPYPDSSSFDPLWVGGANMGIDSFFIHTTTDLRSDHRGMMLFTATGEFVRATYIQAPMGFINGSAAGRLIAAVRDVNRQELILYEWHWKGAGDGQ